MPASKNTTKSTATKQEIVDKPVANNTNENANIDYQSKINELEEIIRQLSAKLSAPSQPQNVVVNGQIMDKPCTLIHLWECVPSLPTTIYVNGNQFTFVNYGEKRKFRFADMQNIVSRYRDFFQRGVFTLGSDCDEFKDDFGVSVMSIPMTKAQHQKLAVMPFEEFSDLIKSLNASQKTIIAKTWLKRCEEGQSGYNNKQKIILLNEESGGMLEPLLH